MSNIMANTDGVAAAPAFGLDVNFGSFGMDFHMPGLGPLTDLIDSLSSQAPEAAPAKVTKLDNVPSYAQSSVPAMRM